jgi:hypothetical protein
VFIYNSGTALGTGTALNFVSPVYASISGTIAYISALTREVLPADRTYYVRKDGSDSNTGLANTSAGAFLTAAKANSVVTTLDKNGHNITVQFSTGTWSESTTINVGIGDGQVYWKGSLVLLQSVSSATVAAGSGGTAGTVTKAGSFTGKTYTGKLCYFQTDAVYRIIASNDSNALTLADVAASSTTQNVDIYDWGTVINDITIDSPQSRPVIQEIRLSNGSSVTNTLYIKPYSQLELYRCSIEDFVFIVTGNLLVSDDSYFHTSLSGGCMQAAYAGQITALQRCFLDGEHTSANILTVSRGGYALISGGTIDGNDNIGGKATFGLYGWGSATIQTNGLGINGNVKVKNCDTGSRATNQTTVFQSAVTYTTCTTNSSADATTYGVIG